MFVKGDYFGLIFVFVGLSAVILMWGSMAILAIHAFSSKQKREQLQRLFKRKEEAPDIDPFFAVTVYRCLKAFRFGAIMAAFVFAAILVVALVLPALGIRLF